MKLLKSHMGLQGATLNSGALMVNPDMDMIVYDAMRRNRSQFKYALRQCKRSGDTIKADRLAGDLLQHNVVDFWENNKVSNSTCIDAVVGDQNIADYRRSHYEGIFNSVQNTTHQNEKLETTEFHENMTVTTNEVAKVIKVFETG